ncbi:SH3 domain-containing protein [Streptomyces sp. NPDC059278]|uniref:SH3 domain-containing protein n=1 Tax=Streptomyces sp. NPDC059278 TaxID=3346801 RepID=UPI0036785B21
MRSVLTADHEIPTRAPLKIQPGDELEVGDRDTEWTAFVFVTSQNGTGWVPARYVDVSGTRGTVLVAYDTTELPASKGDTVDVLKDDPESGWSWCRDSSGREGWVPHRALRAA